MCDSMFVVKIEVERIKADNERLRGALARVVGCKDVSSVDDVIRHKAQFEAVVELVPAEFKDGAMEEAGDIRHGLDVLIETWPEAVK